MGAVGTRDQVGRDGAEVWRLLAEFPYALDPLIWPRMRSLELQCDRTAASLVSPQEIVSALLNLSITGDDGAYTGTSDYQYDSSNDREWIEAPSTHP